VFSLHTLANTAHLEALIEANTALTTTVSHLAQEIHQHVCVNDQHHLDLSRPK
jgi:hypothetical protein